MLRQRCCGTQPHRFCNSLHRLFGLFKTPLCGQQALMSQPFMRCGPGLLPEAPRKRARGHLSVSRQIFHLQDRVQVRLYPL